MGSRWAVGRGLWVCDSFMIRRWSRGGEAGRARLSLPRRRGYCAVVTRQKRGVGTEEAGGQGRGSHQGWGSVLKAQVQGGAGRQGR